MPSCPMVATPQSATAAESHIRHLRPARPCSPPWTAGESPERNSGAECAEEQQAAGTCGCGMPRATKIRSFGGAERSARARAAGEQRSALKQPHAPAVACTPLKNKARVKRTGLNSVSEGIRPPSNSTQRKGRSSAVQTSTPRLSRPYRKYPMPPSMSGWKLLPGTFL